MDHAGAGLVHAWGGPGRALLPPQSQNIPGNICQNICPEAAQGRRLPSPDINTLNVGTVLASPQVPTASEPHQETSSNPSLGPGKLYRAPEKHQKRDKLENSERWQIRASPARGQPLRLQMSSAEERLRWDAGCRGAQRGGGLAPIPARPSTPAGSLVPAGWRGAGERPH